jgi:hypothetical protein
MALDYGEGGRAASRAARDAASGKEQAAVRGQAPANAAESDRAKQLRAMVAARANAPRPTAEAMRQALAKAASAVTGLASGRDRGRGRDNGAER